ncbi:GPI transamidase component PIG-T [Abortiporus biennis]
MNLYLVLLAACLFVTSSHASQEEFHESLTLKPLQDGKVTSHFSFRTLLRGATPRNPETLDKEDNPQHYTLFPLTLGQILREYAVTELHLTLNAGKWDYDRWGYPEEEGVGTGAELWAWMGESSAQSVDQRWSGLRNALSGLFCASIGSLDEQRTTSPDFTFQPKGYLPEWSSSHQIRHGTLPSEHVCTENLTPFLKLLPCKSVSGIATLLNPHKLFDADWHGLGVHVRYLHDVGIEVRLSFQTVADPIRYSFVGKRDWSLRSLFDRAIERSCPVATTSEVRLQLPAESTAQISPDPSSLDNGYATFDISKVAKPLNIAMVWPDELKFEYPLTSTPEPLTHISVHRTLKGYSQSRGVLSIDVTNNMPITIQTSYLESMPWLLQFYLHSLKLYYNGVSRDDLISIVSYTPPVPHSRPTLLQAVLTIPGNSTLHLTLDVIKPFLRYTEHPPDAQRGWDLPPAIFIPLLPSQASGSPNGTAMSINGMEENKVFPNRNRIRPHKIYTPILLVDPATPDFSMPYNVIIMSCTLIALIFGSVFNLLTRKNNDLPIERILDILLNKCIS